MKKIIGLSILFVGLFPCLVQAQLSLDDPITSEEAEILQIQFEKTKANPEIPKKTLLNSTVDFQIPPEVMNASKLNRLVFIDKSELKLWIIEDRKALFSTPIMIGKNERPSPTGVFSIFSRIQNTDVSGPGYSVFVKYWAEFSPKYALHDASWREASEFGNKSIQPTSGSRGCINIPPWNMKKIWDLTNNGTEVHIYE